MQVEILKDYREISHSAASAIIEQVKQKPNSLICLASGDTPKLAYQQMVDSARSQQINFAEVTFIGLDEWIGISPETAGNCSLFLRQLVFSPLEIPEDQIRLFDPMASNLDYECEKMDGFIFKKGRIDLMVVGIGMNGHIGFNEPGISFHLKSHVTDLDDTTQSVGQKYFKETKILTKGITLGLRHLLEAQKVILMANGFKKSEIIKMALQNEVSPEIPASILRNHSNSLVLLDEAAASLLGPKEKKVLLKVIDEIKFI